MSESDMPNVKIVIRMSTLEYIYASDKSYMDARLRLPDEFKELHPDGLSPDDLDYFEDGPEDLALINYTSGTSGFSKGVMLPYRA